jgi:DNA-binding transcriptional LysR family regulator
MSQALNVKHLETFYWIVRLGTFAQAAERLGTTQPTVSARIQELEQVLGVVVFDRPRVASSSPTPSAWSG